MNRFDRILWRINGVLFLVILVLGFLPLAWNFAESWIHRPSRKNAPPILNEAQGTHEKEHFQLGAPSRVTGTSILRTPLYGEASSREYSSFKSSGDRSHTRNYLFLDYSDLSSWWLFETFERAILKEHDFRVGILKARIGGSSAPFSRWPPRTQMAITKLPRRIVWRHSSLRPTEKSQSKSFLVLIEFSPSIRLRTTKF